MELTITGDFAKQILTASRKDNNLARSLARQYLGAVDPQAMAAFLLTPEVAVALLAERLKKNPEATIRHLQRLPERGKPAGPARRGAAEKRRGRKGRRRRLTADQVAELKRQVKAFLARNGWTTRKELTGVVALETQAIYRRIMGELQQAGEVVSRGEKSKAVYALKGKTAGRKGAGKKKSKTSKSKTSKSKSSKSKTARSKKTGR